MSSADALRGFVAAAGDLLLAAVCPGCAAPGLGLCPRCRTVLNSGRPRRRAPDPLPPGFPVAVNSGPYEDPYRGMILAHKEHGALLLAPTLGRLLAESVEELIDLTGADGEPLELVAMPSSRAAVRRRGYDAVATMTRHAARVLRRRGYRIGLGVRLRQRRRIADQAGLGSAARIANLRGGLAVRGWPYREPSAAGWLVLVDDVITTGATVAEAAQTLRSAGFRVLGAASIAATRRRQLSAADEAPDM